LAKGDDLTVVAFWLFAGVYRRDADETVVAKKMPTQTPLDEVKIELDRTSAAARLPRCAP
jgi:hypothetical protein